MNELIRILELLPSAESLSIDLPLDCVVTQEVLSLSQWPKYVFRGPLCCGEEYSAVISFRSYNDDHFTVISSLDEFISLNEYSKAGRAVSELLYSISCHYLTRLEEERTFDPD